MIQQGNTGFYRERKMVNYGEQVHFDRYQEQRKGEGEKGCSAAKKALSTTLLYTYRRNDAPARALARIHTRMCTHAHTRTCIYDYGCILTTCMRALRI